MKINLLQKKRAGVRFSLVSIVASLNMIFLAVLLLFLHQLHSIKIPFLYTALRTRFVVLNTNNIFIKITEE